MQISRAKIPSPIEGNKIKSLKDRGGGREINRVRKVVPRTDRAADEEEAHSGHGVKVQDRPPGFFCP